MGVWRSSRELSVKSWGIVKGNRELLRFPIMAAIFGALGGAVLMGPGFVLLALSDGSVGLFVGGVVLLLLGLYLAAFAVTVFTAGLVGAADDLLHDRPTSYKQGMAAARQVRGALAGWAAVQATVGALLALIRGDGNDGLALTIVRLVAAGIVAAAWQVISFFVLPVIVLERLGAVGAMKRSASIVKDRWGEAVVGTVRVTVRAALWWVIPGLILLGVGVALALTLANAAAIAAGIVLGIGGLVLVIIGAVLSSAARTVFAVALYRYATGNEVVGPFTQSDMDTAIRYKGDKKKKAA